MPINKIRRLSGKSISKNLYLISMIDSTKQVDPLILKKLVEDTKLDENICRLLILRDLDTKEKVEDHLNFRKITESSKLSNMQISVDRIMKAITEKQSIVICGDYDVDGTVSTAMMYRFFKEIGYPVNYYIPHRVEEGYGISAIGIETLVKNGAQLLISVDNGIAAFDAADKAKAMGVDLIITDHHDLIDGKIPNAFAVINPKIDPYDNCRYLSGASVAFYLINELNKRFENKVDLKKYLVLAAVASVADVVPLLKDNRIIVKKGIEMFKDHAISGLMALARSVGMYINKMTAKDIGYKLGPILNAAGRLEGADKTIQLLIEEDPVKIEELITQMKSLNLERRKLTEEAAEKLMAQVDDSEDVIVLSGDHHQGISGIVASRIKDKYHKPVIIISFDGGDIGKASARSVVGFNIKEAIGQSTHHLGGGGHYMAAGFSINKSTLADFKKQINEYAKNKVKQQLVEIDLELNKSALTSRFATQMELLEPFGAKFDYPLVKYSGKITMKKLLKDTHIMLKLDGEITVFIFFKNNINDYSMGKTVEIVGELSVSKNEIKIIAS
jgi:single-stranded-DNA-specific exonuclease